MSGSPIKLGSFGCIHYSSLIREPHVNHTTKLQKNTFLIRNEITIGNIIANIIGKKSSFRKIEILFLNSAMYHLFIGHTSMPFYRKNKELERKTLSSIQGKLQYIYSIRGWCSAVPSYHGLNALRTSDLEYFEQDLGFGQCKTRDSELLDFIEAPVKEAWNRCDWENWTDEELLYYK